MYLYTCFVLFLTQNNTDKSAGEGSACLKSYNKQVDVSGLDWAECCIKEALIVTNFHHVLHNYVVLKTNRTFRRSLRSKNRGYVRLSVRL